MAALPAISGLDYTEPKKPFPNKISLKSLSSCKRICFIQIDILHQKCFEKLAVSFNL